LWDANTGKLKVAEMKHKGLVRGAVFNQQENQILSWSDDGSIKIWDANTVFK